MVLTDDELVKLDGELYSALPLGSAAKLGPLVQQAKLANRYRSALERIANSCIADSPAMIASDALKEASNAP